MKKLLGLFIFLVIADCLLAAALYVQKVREENARMAKILAIQMLDATAPASIKAMETPATDWLTKKAALFQTATAETKPAISWSSAVVQNEAAVVEQEGVYPLKKAPFSLRIRVPRQLFEALPFMMYLNVLDRDEVYQKIQPGSIRDISCEENAAGCFTFAGLAEPGHSNGTLSLDLQSGIGTHLLYYRDAQDNRWDSVEIGDQEVILERRISHINLVKGENNVEELPIEEFRGKALYLVFLLDYRGGPVVSEDELRKAVLRFE